jgi:glycosyltransferase involved in cell wall biosynthesis
MVFEVRDMWPAVPIAMGAIRNPLLVWLARLLEKTTYQRSAHIVALAPGMKDDVVTTGIPTEKVTVIPNGCDVDVFGKTPTKEIGPREKHGWLTGRKLVVFTGTLGKANGVSYMARVAACVKAIDPEIRFVVVGDGADSLAVRKTAEQGGVLDLTFFMFPSLPKHEAAQWVRSADMVRCLFTGPQAIWKDAVQNKFFDSVAAGKPTASNFEGFQSLVAVEQGIGVILDSKDHALAAKQLVETLNNAQWLAGVESRSRVLAEGEFSRDHLAQRLLIVLANTMTSNSC